jgi:hypothetical protein
MLPHIIRHSDTPLIAQRAPFAMSHFVIGQFSGAVGSGLQNKAKMFPRLGIDPAFIRSHTFSK